MWIHQDLHLFKIPVPINWRVFLLCRIKKASSYPINLLLPPKVCFSRSSIIASMPWLRGNGRKKRDGWRVGNLHYTHRWSDGSRLFASLSTSQDLCIGNRGASCESSFHQFSRWRHVSFLVRPEGMHIQWVLIRTTQKTVRPMDILHREHMVSSARYTSSN